MERKKEMVQVNAADVKGKSAAGPDASGPEHRHAQRRRTLKQGRVILTDSTTMDCTIRDLSEGGARLVFGGATQLPKTFALLLLSDHTRRPAELLWQRGLSAGIAFTGPATAAPPLAR
jgi:hypothetical protein